MAAGIAEMAALAGAVLARAAGPEGICGGQQMDLEWEGCALSEEELLQIHLHKTAALIRAACLMGVAAAGGTERQKQAARDYAQAVGLAFQVRDDMLDVTSDAQTMGKSVGKDAAQNKSTFVSLLGLERCGQVVLEQTEKAKEALRDIGIETAFFDALADYLAGRGN